MSENLHMIARIAGRAVAFVAGEVDSVVDLGPVTATPRALPGVVGIAALRSRVATVIDPRPALNLPADGKRPGRAVVAKIDGHLYALLVDDLEDVADYPVMALPPGVSLDGGWAGVGSSMIERDGEPVLVVPLARLIPHAIALAA